MGQTLARHSSRIETQHIGHGVRHRSSRAVALGTIGQIGPFFSSLESRHFIQFGGLSSPDLAGSRRSWNQQQRSSGVKTLNSNQRQGIKLSQRRQFWLNAWECCKVAPAIIDLLTSGLYVLRFTKPSCISVGMDNVKMERRVTRQQWRWPAWREKSTMGAVRKNNATYYSYSPLFFTTVRLSQRRNPSRSLG